MISCSSNGKSTSARSGSMIIFAVKLSVSTSSHFGGMTAYQQQNPYRAKQVVFQVNAAAGQQIGGVKVTDVVESSAPDRMVYEPGNPLADDKGYVRMPNVDVVSEMVNSISASRSYQANVEVMNSAKTLMLKTLTLGQ